MDSSTSDHAPTHNMPQVDRAAATQAAVAARRARAALKEKLRAGELSAQKVLELAKDPTNAASRLRVTEYLSALPTIGATKTSRILEQLAISEKKRLGGLGIHQLARLRNFLDSRFTVHTAAPKLTVLAGPTAVGKGTVVSYIREHFPQIKHSISATTRAPRAGEVHGRDYFFVTDEQFDRMLAKGELLEWAVVHQVHRYGTPRRPIEEMASAGEHVLLEIDLQGARQVRASMPEARLIFLSPPSWDELVDRLVKRGTEGAEERARRLETAKREMSAENEFDYVVVNETVQLAAETIVNLMQS